MNTLFFLLSKIWPRDHLSIKIRVVTSFLCLILAKVFSAFTPLSFKWLVDGLVERKPSIFLVWAIVLYTVTRVMSQIFSELRDGVFSKVTQKVMRELAITVFDHLHRLDLNFHLSRQTGGLNRSLDRGIKGIDMFFKMSLFNLLPVFFEIIFVFVILWAGYGFLYGFIALMSVFAYIAYTFLITSYLIGYVRTMNDSDAKANTRLIDSLLNFETVKYFNNEKLESERLDESLKSYQINAVRNDVMRSFLNAGQSAIVATGLGILMFFAVKDVRSGLISVGDFVMINTFLIQLYIPLFMLGFAYREVKNSLTAMETMFSFLKIQPQIQDKPSATDLILKKGEITFEDVWFSYTTDRDILKGVSFDLKGGETLAIVGETGSGKSTIAKLLFRFFDPKSGKISIDGQNIGGITQESLRKAVGVVPQDTVLFNDTIFYNILYGNPHASKEDIYLAAKGARIHDFIESLPEKYDSLVGERGLKLSGGEKQRVAIARLLLKKPSIFIFDESTSALDTVTEQAIQDNLVELSKKHTTVIIAHRLSTISHANQIIVLDSGMIAEKGTHAQLLKKKGLYFELWSKQSAEQKH